MVEQNHSNKEHPNASTLLSATKGFDHLFSDDIASARKHFELQDDPFHLLGLGVCTFLEAALAMEPGLMVEATRCLTLAEARARKQLSAIKPSDLPYRSRLQYGLEWEVLHADAVVLLGMTHALSESYMGYVKCMYSLKSSHSKFTKLFKIVFPNGLSPVPNSTPPLHSSSPLPPSQATSDSILVSSPTLSTSSVTSNNFISRWIGMSASTPTVPLEIEPDGPVEDLIVSGTAFGFGLFNLVFSLLPKKIQSIVGFFGFQHDRSQALESLTVSSAKLDLHGVFASLVLMTYNNMILALSGYQADEQRLLREIEKVISRVEIKYPHGTLWILNRAKLERMSYNTESAIHMLQSRLQSDKPLRFLQADVMMYFELAWALLSQRMYLEAAEAFTRAVKLNSWSHATYFFLVAGCLLATGNSQGAQDLLDKIPATLEKKRGGREIPTESFIKNKLAFYKNKQHRRGGDSKAWIEAVKINPAEEIGIFWNIHSRVKAPVAQSRINDLMTLTPSISLNENELSVGPSLNDVVSDPTGILVDLDNNDDLAIRALLLGINYGTQSAFGIGRHLLDEARKYQETTSTWVPGIAMFEMAVMDLKETEIQSARLEGDERKKVWSATLKEASRKLDCVLSLSGSTVDMSGRLESRVTILRDEIATKAVMEAVDF